MRDIMFIRKFILSFLSLLLAMTSYADEKNTVKLPTSQEICDRYINYLSQIENIKFKSEIKSSLKSPHQLLDLKPSQHSIILTTNAVKYEQQVIATTQIEGKLVEQQLKQEILYNDKKGIDVYAYEDGKMVVNADMTTHPQNFAERLKYLSEKIVFGYEWFGDKKLFFLPQILKNSKLALNFDEQRKKWTMNAENDDSNFKIYFEDINKGVPQQIIFNRAESKKKLYDIVSIDFTISKFQTIKGIQVPLEMKITREKIVPNQQVTFDPVKNESNEKAALSKGTGKRIETIQAVWSDIAFVEKDVSFNFKMEEFIKIPNGTEVHVKNVPQIEYVWMDGKIVVKTDEVALAIARGGHKFIPGHDEPRFWMMALGIIMMLVGGGLKLRDMLKES
jgi:hypothetical protein